jgi:transcriptional regulator GlxA family with amidase domain
MNRKNTAIFIFDEVEVLDFAGPFEVFSVANLVGGGSLRNVYTVAMGKGPVLARNGLSVNPHYAVDEAPKPDLFIIPGGLGTRPLVNRDDVISWIRKTADNAEKVLSVCTGALLLAKAGLLDGLTATTHHGAFDLLAQLAPNTKIARNERFVDNGKIITSAGISAGIDMSLYVVEMMYGKETAQKTVDWMEYRRI